MKSSLIINIPHSQTFIPQEELSYFFKDKLEQELRLMTDHFTDDLFDFDFEKIIFPLSRIVCDVERFRNDEEEIMAQRGMGAIYRICHNLEPLREISEEHKKYLLEKYYDNYHLKFTQRVEEKLNNLGKCLIIDAHSFSAIPLPYEDVQDKNRPDICIGTDFYHTPSEISDFLFSYF